MGRSSKPVVALLPHALVQIKRFQGKDEPSGMYFRRLHFDVNFSYNSWDEISSRAHDGTITWSTFLKVIFQSNLESIAAQPRRVPQGSLAQVFPGTTWTLSILKSVFAQRHFNRVFQAPTLANFNQNSALDSEQVVENNLLTIIHNYNQSI